MVFEVTEEQYLRNLEGGRFTLHPGWYYIGEDGPEGPYTTEEEALSANRDKQD